MEYFKVMDADVFCLQETKCQVGQVVLVLPGYHQYWNQTVKKFIQGQRFLLKSKHFQSHMILYRKA